ncbi:uncharacterized protein LOC135826833 [Sycon ciliatum]|uniref:uncharacterized protein LOC135826833 n=1 Tax=Sycon ciliatum TaxID=27933 RepID=UPI0031F6DB6B
MNQCSDFNSSIAEHAAPLRGLLKPPMSSSGHPEHTTAMNATKEALLDPPSLAHFDPTAPTRLECDAARTKGLGLGLWQLPDGSWRLTQFGSRFLSDTETRYDMIELELFGVAWAVQKCHIFLAGMPFQVIVDHQPLVLILHTYTLDQIENPRLQRLVAKVTQYQLSVSWHDRHLVDVIGSEHQNCSPPFVRARDDDFRVFAEVTEGFHVFLA